MRDTQVKSVRDRICANAQEILEVSGMIGHPDTHEFADASVRAKVEAILFHLDRLAGDADASR